MSQENVEIVRRALDAFNRRDFDAWLEKFDHDVEWYAFPDEPDPGPFRGHEAIRAMVARWMDVLDEFRSEPKEFIAAGDYVLMPARMIGRVQDTEHEVTIDEVYLNKLRDGAIVEVREFRTREEAFEAAGFSEEDAHSDP
jgi:ketosteroid isomerase-like protein